MIRRILLTLALLVGLAAPALAQEINTDTGCDSSGAWMPGTGWSVSGSKCVASSATRMAMLMQNSTAIKANHRYKITFDVSGYTGSGILRAFMGVKMGTAPTGSWVTAASVTPVADNFTTSLGLNASAVYHSTTGPGDDGEQNGSWRITCLSGGFGRVDPLVYPNMQSPHLHEFIGADNIKPNWGYSDFRTKAQSSCNNPNDPQHTINRSGYWAPAVIEGGGRPVRTWGPDQIYYKGPASTTVPESVTVTGGTGGVSSTTLNITAVSVAAPITPDQMQVIGTGIPANTAIRAQIDGTPGGVGHYTLDTASTVPDGTTITLESPYKVIYGNVQGTAAAMCSQMSLTTDCQNIPTGLRFTFGYKSSCNTVASPLGCLGPLDTSSTTGSSSTERTSMNGISGTWECRDATTNIDYTPTYNSLQDMMNAGTCNIIGSIALRTLNFPVCWDGTNVDSPDHRAHMSFGTSSGACLLAGHTVVLPHIQMLLKYVVDADLVAGKWHLSSDEMAACYDTGGLAGCTDHADYYEAWSPTVRAAWYANCNLAHNSCSEDFGTGALKDFPFQWGGTEQVDHSAAPENYGMSRDITANGSYTFYITSVDDGVWGFLGMKSLSASIDNIHVTDLGAAAKGPVTVH